MQQQSIEAMNAAVNKRVIFERKTIAPEIEPEINQEPTADIISSADILKALEANEDGDAGLYIRLHKNHFIYDHAAGTWHVKNGHHWTLDTKEEALAGVADVTDVYLTEMKKQAWIRASAEKSGQTKNADAAKNLETILARRVRDLQTIRRKQAVLHIARAGAESLGISGDEWDNTDPLSLPVENIIIDLRTGNTRDAAPCEYFKNFAPTIYKGIDEPRPTWEAFLNGVFKNNAELIEFIRRLSGYAITGKTTESVFGFFFGGGANGKTVFIQTLADVLGGDLAGPIEAEMLLESRFTRLSGGPSSDLLHLRGRRLTWLSETNENRSINSGKVKLFTGGDLITGRAPYGARQITFKPTHKIFLLTNHKPKADAQDSALWRRVLLIPFETVFSLNPDPAKNEKLADLEMAEKLRAEKSGILGWLVQGCLEWQRQGLNPPDIVKAATKQYREGEDTLKTFINERCIEGPTFSVRAGLLYINYKQWAEQNGERPVTSHKFGRYFGDLFDSIKDRTGKSYLGIGLCET